MPSRTPKRALAAVFAAVPLVTCVFAVQGVCAEPPADVVVGFVDRPEPGYYSRTAIPTLAAMARASHGHGTAAAGAAETSMAPATARSIAAAQAEWRL